LFNILAPHLAEARFLDLCAGTGAVGIEALSRGASHATFVDQSRKMCSLIATNLNSLEISPGDYEVIAADAADYLRRYVRKAEQRFDIVYYDPPYANEHEVLLNFLGEHASQILEAGAIVIVEHYKKTLLTDRYRTLNRHRELKQGDSTLSFYRVS